MVTTMFEFKILLSSGSVDRGSRIKEACGEHVHMNINTPHTSPIPTPKKRGTRAKKTLKTTQFPPDVRK